MTSPLIECQVCSLLTTNQDALCAACRQLLDQHRRPGRRPDAPPELPAARHGVRPRHTKKRR